MQLNKDTLFANRFRLIELKGRGSFGEVWLAHDEQLDMEVAIKIYIALDDRGVADFKKEYKTTFGLSHPNLLHAYHFDQCDDRPYLVMPYCPNSSVTLIGHADETTLWHFIRDVASGLAYLHEEDIVHRDIKPDNVLIDQQGRFLITDFGISTKLRTTLLRNSQHNANVGTVPYMAPELFNLSGNAVYASDVWSLGATLYEMASGELPFFGQGGVMLHNGATISRPNLPYSKGLIDTILECLEKEPWNRPKAIDLANRAQKVINGHTYEGRPEVPEESPEPPFDIETGDPQRPLDDIDRRLPGPKPKMTWLWVLLAVLLGGGGFALWKLSNGKSEKYDSKADNTMFQNCKTGNDYRAYMKAYPVGVGAHFELAQSRLEEWVRDSINQAQNLTQVAEDGQTSSDSEQSTTQPEEKKKDNKKVETKPGPETPTENNERTMEQEEEERSSGSSSQPESKKNETEQTKGNSQLTEVNQQQTNEKKNPNLTETPKLTIGGGLGLSQNQASPSSEEEAYQRATGPKATLEDCIYWMDKYGDIRTRDKQKWKTVRDMFWQLYSKKLRECTTAQDCERFINEHDGIMKRARLAGTDGDKNMRRAAEERKKSLESKS